ncbi:NTP transferase domain-containing protein [Niallia sp. Sow4_A1]|uniref:NTP transferase domain-containing protein n=1 Tax=Niallia hominis TaxID=3133173 RepID=A0ABV1EWG5_9BACI|nr:MULTISPECIES: NTP transferase domain-containing protein [Bacillaceae]MCM3364166.1 NTP transferase domain-containing protein [Niallia sp. MER TA 168]
MITAIYLAAGKSSRMGEHKLSLTLGQNTIGNAALSELLAASFIDYSLVIVQPDDTLDWISLENKNQLFGKKGEIIRCKEADLGQSYSLKAGFAAAVERKSDKILVCLADQPFVTANMLSKLVKINLKPPEEYVASMYNGVIMPPILFHPNVYENIKPLKGDWGARKLLNNGALQGKKIEFSEEIYFIDIDTKSDYEKALARREQDENICRNVSNFSRDT